MAGIFKEGIGELTAVSEGRRAHTAATGWVGNLNSRADDVANRHELALAAGLIEDIGGRTGRTGSRGADAGASDWVNYLSSNAEDIAGDGRHALAVALVEGVGSAAGVAEIERALAAAGDVIAYFGSIADDVASDRGLNGWLTLAVILVEDSKSTDLADCIGADALTSKGIDYLGCNTDSVAGASQLTLASVLAEAVRSLTLVPKP